MIKRLSELNGIEIKDVNDKQAFKTYGKVLSGYDFSSLIEYMKTTEIPLQNNIYVASCADMEKLPICNTLKNTFYGGMDIEIGYCNGKNSTYNGFEYHKGSEINIAITDMLLVLGHTWDMEDNTYKVEDAEVFFVPKGTAIELYQTTLHLSPCKVSDDGFKAIVILPRGTNNTEFKKDEIISTEDKILLFQNKWVIAHKDREPLVKAGAFIGLVGENKELKY
ncbi:DUF4867 domain-containing protein [Candidatus Epulonipiscium fishelsonii]|uniref:DUF4867 domain-containing protein n=1 Tax=Candidatus Epulonipiscium fishelsonii TaxID=77094 RepID=A0ACC8XCI0_9FIRM|nr:DUF4867 domain-containing protein [Epulopiscium sp. SCG-B11WGA-EpuloA1]